MLSNLAPDKVGARSACSAGPVAGGRGGALQKAAGAGEASGPRRRRQYGATSQRSPTRELDQCWALPGEERIMQIIRARTKKNPHPRRAGRRQTAIVRRGLAGDRETACRTSRRQRGLQADLALWSLAPSKGRVEEASSDQKEIPTPATSPIHHEITTRRSGRSGGCDRRGFYIEARLARGEMQLSALRLSGRVTQYVEKDKALERSSAYQVGSDGRGDGASSRGLRSYEQHHKIQITTRLKSAAS